MTNKPMMKCGHQANATCSKSNGQTFDPPLPSCAICNCVEVVEPPDLSGRFAECSYSHRRDGKPCTSKRPSELSYEGKLAFFEHRPDKDADVYYCGCWGWD